MSKWPPVVFIHGRFAQLPPGDTLSGPHAKFTASSTLPAVSAGGNTMVLTVSPVLAGDSLAAGEDITVQPTAALPGGLNIAWWLVSGTNTVTVGLSSTVTLAVGTVAINWRVTAHR